MDPLRLEDRDARELFDEIAARGAKALEEFAAALSTLGRAGIWTAVETGRRSAIVKYLLAAALDGEGIHFWQPWWTGGEVEEYVKYLDRTYTVRVRLTDSNDAIVVRHFVDDEIPDLRDDEDRVRAEVEELAPLLLVVAGVGLVFWSPEVGTLPYEVAESAVTLTADALRHYANEHPDCFVPVDGLEAAPKKMSVDATGRLISAFVLDHVRRVGPLAAAEQAV
jgi:hypothetical protein